MRKLWSAVPVSTSVPIRGVLLAAGRATIAVNPCKARVAAQGRGFVASVKGSSSPQWIRKSWARSLSGTSSEISFVEIPMPKLVPNMEEGVLSKWLVKEGQELQAGDLLCEVDVVGLSEDHKSDSVTLLIESHEDGFVARLLEKEGAIVKVDRPIGVMVEEHEHVSAFGEKTEDGRLFCWQAYLKEE